MASVACVGQWLGLHHADFLRIKTAATAANIEPWSNYDSNLVRGLDQRLSDAAASGDPDAEAWRVELQRSCTGREKCDLEALTFNGGCVARFVEVKILRRQWL